MARNLSFIAKYFLSALFAMTLFFVVPHTASAIGWDDGSIAAEHVTFTPYSNGVVASIVIKVDPPTNDADHNGSLDNTATELGRWIYVNGHAGVDNLNSEGFAVEIATDSQFSNIIVNHDISISTNVLRTVPAAYIAPPLDQALTPGTHYFGRVIGLNAGNLTKVTLFSSDFTTLAAGRDLTSNGPDLDQGGNQIVSNGNNTTAQDLSSNSGLPECGVWGSSKVMGCVAQVIYYVIYTPTSYVMVLAGEIMDWGLGYSIDSNSYPVQGETFVTNGWRIMRDLANMLFIFILVYIAITTILGNGSARNIGMVILVALIINFSLFFTKVVIDVGNIMARVFYNQIAICSKTPWQSVNQAQPSNACERTGYTEIIGSGEYKSVSYGFTAIFNPIKLFDGVTQGVVLTGSGGQQIASGLSEGQLAGFFALFSFVGALVNLVAAFVFFSLAWLFIGRVVALWLAMIFAPLAFIGLALPKIGGISSIEQFNISKWWEDLFKNSMMPAIAMIMFFLIIMFLNRGFLGQLETATTTTGKFMSVLLPLIILTILLLAVKKTAETLSGKMGAAMGKVGSFVGGAALGVATGGAALAGRRVLGGLGGAVARSESLKETAIGRGAISIGRRMETATYDLKNTKIAQFGAQKAGLDLNATKAVGVNTNVTKGYKEYRDNQMKAREEYKESMKLGKDSKEVLAMEEEKEKLDKAKEARDGASQEKRDAQSKYDIALKRFKNNSGSQAEVDAAEKELKDKEVELDKKEVARIEKELMHTEAKKKVEEKNAKILGSVAKGIDASDEGIAAAWDNIKTKKTALGKTTAFVKAVGTTYGNKLVQGKDVITGSISGREAMVAKIRKESKKASTAADKADKSIDKLLEKRDKIVNPQAPASTTQTTPQQNNQQNQNQNQPYARNNIGQNKNNQQNSTQNATMNISTPQNTSGQSSGSAPVAQVKMSGIFNQQGPSGQVTNNPGGNTAGIGQTRMSGAGVTMKTFNNVGNQPPVNTAAGTTRSDYNGIKPSIDERKDINIKTTGGDSSVNFGKGSTVNINMPEGEGRAVTREELYRGTRFGFKAPDTNQIRTVTSQPQTNQRQEIGFRADRSQMSAGDKSADIAKEIGFRGAQTRQDLGINNTPSSNLNPGRTVVQGFGGAKQTETPVQKTGDQLIREKLLNEARGSTPTPPPKPPEQK